METRTDKRAERVTEVAAKLGDGDYDAQPQEGVAGEEGRPEPPPEDRFLCGLAPRPPRVFDPSIDPGRSEAILVSDSKWVNGTTLRYCFLEDPPVTADRQVVINAFQAWRDIPIGLQFQEVGDPGEAEIRITFDQDDGSWSTVGRDALLRPSTMATMNFGWQLSGWTYGRDTAIHEIGHAVGLPHEHQNPMAGIVWDEPAVIADLAGAPNFWDEETTRWNILRKIAPDTVQGSAWDPNSIMHYAFGPGLIIEPPEFQVGLVPEPGFSARDLEWATKFYPPNPDGGLERLVPFESKSLDLAPGEQVNFSVVPDTTGWYQFGTFGSSDTVLVLFEEVTTGPEESQGLRFRAGDDDSGSDRNAHFWAKLFKGQRYVLRLRLYWPGLAGRTAVMMWQGSGPPN